MPLVLIPDCLVCHGVENLLFFHVMSDQDVAEFACRSRAIIDSLGLQQCRDTVRQATNLHMFRTHDGFWPNCQTIGILDEWEQNTFFCFEVPMHPKIEFGKTLACFRDGASANRGHELSKH